MQSLSLGEEFSGETLRATEKQTSDKQNGTRGGSCVLDGTLISPPPPSAIIRPVILQALSGVKAGAYGHADSIGGGGGNGIAMLKRVSLLKGGGGAALLVTSPLPSRNRNWL